MTRIIRLLAAFGAARLASAVLGRVRRSPGVPGPLKWCATAALAFLAVRK